MTDDPRDGLHVLINAAGANVGGAVTYLGHVLRELVALEPQDRFTVLAPPEALAPVQDLFRGPSCDSVVYPHPPRSLARRLWLDQVEVPRLARRIGADVLFSANGFGTFRRSRPQVLLVRNAAYFSRELERLYRDRGRSTGMVRLRRGWSVLSIRTADRVVFPTAAMRARVRSYTRLDEGRTRVVPYGFSRGTFFGEDAPRPDAADVMARCRAGGERVLLSVSAHALHKNLETLVEALATVRKETERVRLVLTIARERTGDPAAYDALFRRIAELGLNQAVINAGHVSHGSLHHLYREADAFVFPSFLESFGHPMVEAMACGLPVVAADTEVNREVLGEAAVYFDTFVPDRCAGAILDLLGGAAGLREAASRSSERAARFSWRAHATALRDVFSELVSRGEVS